MTYSKETFKKDNYTSTVAPSTSHIMECTNLANLVKSGWCFMVVLTFMIHH